MAEGGEEDFLDKWGRENKVQDSSIEALKAAGFEFEDLLDIEESDIDKLNDGKGLPIGHRRRLLNRIQDFKKAQNFNVTGITITVYANFFLNICYDYCCVSNKHVISYSC